MRITVNPEPPGSGNVNPKGRKKMSQKLHILPLAGQARKRKLAEYAAAKEMVAATRKTLRIAEGLVVRIHAELERKSR
jgi:hypothetical protein